MQTDLPALPENQDSGGGDGPDEMIGSVFGERYRIDARIGEGGMGVVYRAYQGDLERLVAIKLPRKSRAFDRAHLQRFAREAQVLSRLLHPNIAAVHAAGSAPDGRPFLSMELVDGVPLSQLLADPDVQHRMRCLPLLIDVAGALAHAHDRGVVHRDLKPANVMVVRTAKGESAKVLDFGVSKLLDAQTEMKATATGCVIGSPAYMSPEQFTNGTVTASSDIYSFGCLLYELLAGHPPFQHEAVYSMLQAHLHETAAALSFPPELQPLGTKLELVAAKAMQKDPRDRFANMCEIHDLLKAIARDPLTPLDIVLPTETKPAGGLRLAPRAVAIACGLVCVTLALVVGYDSLLSGRHSEVSDGENSLAHATTARNLFNQQKYDEAEMEARTALAQAKNPFQRRTALLTLARCLEESPHKERHVLAMPMFEELLQQALKEPKRTDDTDELVQRGYVSTAEIAMQAHLPQFETLALRAYGARQFFGPEDWRRPRLMATVARRRGDFKTAVMFDDEMLKALDRHTPPEDGTAQMAAVAAEDYVHAGGDARGVKAKILKILQRPQAEEETNDALNEALDRALGLGK